MRSFNKRPLCAQNTNDLHQRGRQHSAGRTRDFNSDGGSVGAEAVSEDRQKMSKAKTFFKREENTCLKLSPRIVTLTPPRRPVALEKIKRNMSMIN